MNDDKNAVVSKLVDDKILSDILEVKNISVGMSGANVYEIKLKKDNLVLKVCSKSLAVNSGALNSYIKEFEFYNIASKRQLKFLPEIYFLENNSHFIILLMKKYDPLLHSKWNSNYVNKLIDTVTDIHMLPYSDFGLTEPAVHDDKTIKQNPQKYLDAWINLLSRYNGYFDQQFIYNIAEYFNILLSFKSNVPKCFTHGDFHLNNLLLDSSNNENLLVCDWQNIGVGSGVNDLSFFISRGNADGLNLNETEIIEKYCHRFSKKSGINLRLEDALRDKAVTTILVSFQFWPEYLQEASRDRIEGIYNEMVSAFRYFTS